MLHPLQSDAPLIVYIDVKSPYAFIALKPTLALEAELGLQFDFRRQPSTYRAISAQPKRKRAGGALRARRWRKIVRYAYRDAADMLSGRAICLKAREDMGSSLPISAFYGRQQA